MSYAPVRTSPLSPPTPPPPALLPFPLSPSPPTHLFLKLRDERGSDEAGPHDADANGGVGEVEAAVYRPQATLTILLVDQDRDVVLRGALRYRCTESLNNKIQVCLDSFSNPPCAPARPAPPHHTRPPPARWP